MEHINEDTNDNNLLKAIRKPLFINTDFKEEAVRLSDVIPYGMTINIRPNNYINRKLWKTYNLDEQKKILIRIEQKLRRDTPSIQLDKLMFEICPKNKVIHFHALYRMPPILESTVEAYYNRVCNKLDTTGWRVIDLQPIYDEQGWINYIQKDLKI